MRFAAVMPLVGAAVVGIAGLAARSSAHAQAGLEGQWRVWANADDVLALAVEGDIVWSGSRNGGLARWDATDSTYEQYLAPQTPIPGNNVRAIAIDANGWKWLATERGLAMLDDGGTADPADDRWLTWTRRSTDGALPTDDLWSVAVEGTTVWVGGSQMLDPETDEWGGGGLGRLDARGTFDVADDVWAPVVTFASTYSRTPNGRETLGLVSDAIRGLQPVPGGLWVAAHPHWTWDVDPVTSEGSWRSVHGGLSFVDTAGTFDPTDDEWDAYTCQSALRDASGRPVIGCLMGPIALDSVNNVWVAAAGLGVIAFAADQKPLFGRTVHRFDDESGLAGSAALTVAGSADPNAVWIGLRDAGVVFLEHGGTLADRTDDYFLRFDTTTGLSRNRIQAIAMLGSTALLGSGPKLGNGGGIIGVDEAGTAVASLVTAAPVGRAPPSNFLTDIAMGDAGTPWDNAVWVATGSRKQQRFGVGVGLMTLGAASADDAWTVYTAAGTDGNGAAPFDGLAGDNVHAVLVDGPRVWFGSAESLWDPRRAKYTDGGLSVYSDGEWTARTAGAGLRDGSISSLAMGCDGRLWAGTGAEWSFGMGVDVLAPTEVHDPSGDAWEHFGFPQLPSDNVRGVAHSCEESNPATWVAGVHSARGGVWSDGGVSRRDAAGTWTRYDVNNGFTSFGEAFITGEATSLTVAGPNVWAGAFGAAETTEMDIIATAPYWPATINHFRDGVWSATVFPGLGWIADVAVDAAGRLWAATSRGGLARAGESADSYVEDRNLPGLQVRLGESWIGVGGGDGLPVYDVSAVHVAHDGDVWITTEGWGLARYSERVVPTSTPTPSASPTATTGDESPSPSATDATTTITPGSPTVPTQPSETATPTGSGTVSPTTSPTSSATSIGPLPARIYLPSLLRPTSR